MGNNAAIRNQKYAELIETYRVSDKAFLIGCNRSGSTLLFTIIKHLLARKNDRYVISEVERSARYRYEATVSELDSLFSEAGAEYTAQGAMNFKSMDYFGCGRDNTFFYLTGIPSDRYIFDRVHRTYSMLSADILDGVLSKGYAVFSPVRNPLDVIVSNAFEIEYVSLKMEESRQIDQSQSDFKDQYGLGNLSDLKWFRAFAAYVKRYYEAYLSSIDKVFSVKYEDVIRRPHDIIVQIARKLNVEISQDEVRLLWDKVGFKSLAKFNSHMFRPGADKWREYFYQDHFKILKDLDYGNLLELLECDSSFDSVDCSANKTRYDVLREDPVIRFHQSVHDYIWETINGTPVSFVDARIQSVRIPVSGGSSLHMVSNSREFLSLGPTVAQELENMAVISEN